MDLKLVGIEDAVLCRSGARPDRSLRSTFPEGLLVIPLLLHTAEPVRGQKVLLLYLLLRELLSTGLEALAAA